VAVPSSIPFSFPSANPVLLLQTGPHPPSSFDCIALCSSSRSPSTELAAVHPLPKFVVLTSPRPNSLVQLLLHPLLQHLDPTQFGSQLPSAGFAFAPSRCSPAPPKINPVVDSFSRLASSPSRYTNRFPMACWCSCAFPLPTFDGPSPGTPELRLGRRTHSSTAKFHSYFPEHIPSRAFHGFCGPCLARSPSPECSPPARTPTADRPAVAMAGQGPFCK
jgi:hypothetical protein